MVDRFIARQDAEKQPSKTENLKRAEKDAPPPNPRRGAEKVADSPLLTKKVLVMVEFAYSPYSDDRKQEVWKDLPAVFQILRQNEKTQGWTLLGNRDGKPVGWVENIDAISFQWNSRLAWQTSTLHGRIDGYKDTHKGSEDRPLWDYGDEPYVYPVLAIERKGSDIKLLVGPPFGECPKDRTLGFWRKGFPVWVEQKQGQLGVIASESDLRPLHDSSRAMVKRANFKTEVRDKDIRHDTLLRFGEVLFGEALERDAKIADVEKTIDKLEIMTDLLNDGDQELLRLSKEEWQKTFERIDWRNRSLNEYIRYLESDIRARQTLLSQRISEHVSSFRAQYIKEKGEPPSEGEITERRLRLSELFTRQFRVFSLHGKSSDRIDGCFVPATNLP